MCMLYVCVCKAKTTQRCVQTRIRHLHAAKTGAINEDRSQMLCLCENVIKGSVHSTAPIQVL